MKPDSIAKLDIPSEEFTKNFKKYITSPAYRNVIGLAAFQFDTMVKLYEELKKTGQEVIKEIDSFIEP